jgi:hypothetical protein
VSQDMHTIERLDTPAMHDSKLVPLAWAVCAIGAAAFAACFFVDGGAPRAWSAILAGLMLPLWLAVGSLFFIAAHTLCGARWTVPFLRVMEGVGAGLPLAVLGFVAIAAFGVPYLYEWANADARASLFRYPDGSKAHWMQTPRWIATCGLILAVWLALRWRLAAVASFQDEAARERAVRWSVATLIVLVPSLTLLAWDTLLSLEVQWVSAVFGGYVLIGAIHAFLGATAVLLAWQSSRGLKQVARPHLLKDVGTWLVAWSCIVAYVCYVQYVIIAFANIDEETFWYLKRMQHGYGTQFLVETALRCGLPFLLLMSQKLRARPWALGVAGGGVLIGTWLELHWLIVPAFSPNHYRHPAGPEAMVALGFLAGAFLLAVRYWRRRGLVPEGDPRLLPAINAEHLH